MIGSARAICNTMAVAAALGLGSGALLAAAGAADDAAAACQAAVSARTGSQARVFKVSGETLPIVEVTATGNVSYTCFANADGKIVRVNRNKNSDQ